MIARAPLAGSNTPHALNAPGSYHVDCVIALALANSERYQFKWSGEIRLLPTAPRVARLRVGRRVLAG